MKILGIETATALCGAAIAENGTVLSESGFMRARVHAEKLIGQIEVVLEKAGLTKGEIEGIAVSIGPGSFTGLRIGLSVAKGLAWSLEKPLVAVSTLKALARNAVRMELVQDGSLVLTAVDARQGELYCCLYETGGGALRALWEERIVTPEQLGEELKGKSVTMTGDSMQARTIGIFDPPPRILAPDVSGCSPAAVALEGEKMLERGESVDLPSLEPRYIKQFVPIRRTPVRS